MNKFHCVQNKLFDEAESFNKDNLHLIRTVCETLVSQSMHTVPGLPHLLVYTSMLVWKIVAA